VAAIEETAYALDVLKLDSVAFDASSDSKYLGDAYYAPWLEGLNRRRDDPYSFSPAARIGLLEPLFGRRALTDAEIQSGLSSCPRGLR